MPRKLLGCSAARSNRDFLRSGPNHIQNWGHLGAVGVRRIDLAPCTIVGRQKPSFCGFGCAETERYGEGLLCGEGGQVDRQLVEGGGEALVEGVEHRFEELHLFFGWVEGMAHEGESCEVELFAEVEGIENLGRPLGVERGAGHVALRVGERIYKDETIGRKNLAVYEFAPH